MIDKDEMRIARRTVERNGYTVLPPRRDDEERELNRYRLRQREREELRTRRAAPVEDEEIEDRPQRFKPLRRSEERPIRRMSDEGNDRPSRFSREERPVRRYADEDRPSRRYADEEDVERTTRRYADEEDRPTRRYVDERPIRRQADERPLRRLSPEDELELAKITAQRNGFEVRKMTKLDQAKEVAKQAGFDVRKIQKPIQQTQAQPQQTQPQEAPIQNTNTDDEGVKLRTTPDIELKNRNQQIEDDYVNRAAKFFGEDE